MLRKFIASGIIMFVCAMASAQDSAKTSSFTITGAADVYYKYDFGQSKANNFTSFTNSHNSFELGMANVKFEHQTKKLDMVADLAFGNREKEFAYNDAGIAQAIKQLYISYSPASWLKLTAGSWATHVNYELADAYANRNYSMSYLFTYGPFSHTGIKAEMIAGKSFFMAGVSNATDYRTPPDGQIKKKFFIAQYVYSPNDNVKLYLNYVGGQAPDTSKSRLFNLIVTTKLSDKFNVVYNGILTNVKLWDGIKNDNAKNWWGSALYFNFDPKAWLGFTLRGEYFEDQNRLNVFKAQDLGGNIFSTTFSANLKANNLTFIPEFRIDNASLPIFVKSDGSATKTAANVLLAAIYQF